MVKRSLVSQIAAMGEGAINKNILGGGITQRTLEGALSLKNRVEGVVRGLAEVEDRVAVLEARVEKLEREKPKPAARKPAARKTTAASSKTPAKSSTARTTKAAAPKTAATKSAAAKTSSKRAAS